jgi:hypothetical protein
MSNTLFATFFLFLQFTMAMDVYAQAAAKFSDLENILLSATELSLEFQITASGAMQASIEGSLQKGSNGDVDLLAKGDFAGQAIDLFVRQKGQSFEFGRRANPQSAEPPVALWNALVIGLTRMGVLHNIANLSAEQMPDHASAGVADWVTVNNIHSDEYSHAFDIVVAGTAAGSAKLTLDTNKNPLKREQRVAFPGGEMIVVENYFNVLLRQ